MTSPREIREYNEREAMIARLPVDLRQRVESGELNIFPGKNPDKPVLRDATTGQLVPGSGQVPGAADGARVGRETGWKRSRGYAEAMEAFLPVLANVGDEERASVKRSFEGWLEKVFRAAEGTEVRARCMHEGCSDKHLVYLKPDANLMWRITERLVGAAARTEVHDASDELLAAMMADRTPTVVVFGEVDSNERERRRQVIIEGGLEIDKPTGPGTD